MILETRVPGWIFSAENVQKPSAVAGEAERDFASGDGIGYPHPVASGGTNYPGMRDHVRQTSGEQRGPLDNALLAQLKKHAGPLHHESWSD